MSNETELIEAIKAGDLTYVKNCGLSDKDINDKKYKCEGLIVDDDSSTTLLIIAVYFGHLNIVKYLIERGAQVKGFSLMRACAKGYTDIVEYLISQGADVNLSSDHKISPLMEAIFNEHINIIKLLLAAGADVNHRDWLNWTPLYYAVETKNCDIIKLLISHGVIINNKKKCSWCPYVKACALGSTEMMKIVINCHTDMKNIHICVNEALVCSVYGDSFGMVIYLCEQGASVESSFSEFWYNFSVLMKAAQNNNFPMVKYLIQQGADPARLNEYDKRASDFTTNKEIKQYLLEQEDSFLPVKANNMMTDD